MKTEVYLANNGRPQYGVDAKQEDLLDWSFNEFLEQKEIPFRFINEAKEERNGKK